jgi:putative oxidoreductase
MSSPSLPPTAAHGLWNRLSVPARTFARRAEFIAPLLARATVGYAFVESGWGKVNNLATVTEYFAELGIPAPALQAPFVSLVELIGGALVLVGLATRLAAVPLIGTMVVALVTAKASDISSFSDLIGTIELCYAVLLAWLAVSGAGTISLDHAILRRASPSAGSDMLAASLARARLP